MQYSFRFRRWWVFILVCFGLLNSADAGLRIYYVRHAEGGHNVVGEWRDKPKDQWPAYVGNANVFTPKGEAQVAALTKKLKPYSFDFIAVSPVWRARHTILPYLKESGAKAEIWPELEEYRSYPTNLHSGLPLPPPSTNLFTGEGKISVPEPEKPFFTLRDDGRKHFKLAQDPAQFAADAGAVADKMASRIRARFGGSDKSILLVGHDHNGRVLLETLLKRSDLPPEELSNTGLWMAEEQRDGSFKLRLFNDRPVAP